MNLDVDGVMLFFLADICFTGDLRLTLQRYTKDNEIHPKFCGS